MADVSKQVEIVIGAKDKSSKTLKKVTGSLKKFGLAAGAAAGALGVTAVKAAADFEEQMNNVATLIDGDATEAIDGLKKGILEMMKEVPVSADDLGAASYDVISAGIEGTADQLLVLKESAKLGVAGLADTGASVKIVTGALNSFGFEASESNKVTDILFKTVKQGINTIDDVAKSFGITAPVVASAGVSLEEFSAATAALTSTTTPASVAQTRLVQATLSLQAPTDAMTKLFKKAGIESGQAALENEGLVATMQKVVTAADGDAAALKRAFGSTEALGAALSLTGEQAESFTNTLLSMTEGSNAVDEAFEKQTAGFKKQFELLKNALFPILLNIGDQLLPMVTDAVKQLSTWLEENQGMVNSLTGAFVKLVEMLFKGISVTFQIIGALRQFVVDVKTSFILLQREAGGVWGALWESVKNLARSALDFVIQIVKDAVMLIPNLIKNSFLAPLKFAQGAVNKIAGLGRKAAGSVPKFQDGGIVPGTPGQAVPIIAHAGELILNKKQQQALATRVNNISPNININMGGVSVSNQADEGRLATRIKDEILREMKLNTLGVAA